MKEEQIITQFWNEFLTATKRDESQRYFECFHFDLNEQSANYLLDLVLKGIKRATASSLLYYRVKDEMLPQVGDLSIVTDWDGIPKCVIETTAVTIIPFRDVTYDICKREGEDDNLESWQKGHISFFTQDGLADGYEFSWDMPVVFEDFQVIYK